MHHFRKMNEDISEFISLGTFCDIDGIRIEPISDLPQAMGANFISTKK